MPCCTGMDGHTKPKAFDYVPSHGSMGKVKGGTKICGKYMQMSVLYRQMSVYRCIGADVSV